MTDAALPRYRTRYLYEFSGQRVCGDHRVYRADEADDLINAITEERDAARKGLFHRITGWDKDGQTPEAIADELQTLRAEVARLTRDRDEARAALRSIATELRALHVVTGKHDSGYSIDFVGRENVLALADRLDVLAAESQKVNTP